VSEVFVSYARRDSEAVRRFIAALRKDGHSVSFDQELVPGGQLWREKIVKAIGRADVVLVMLSSRSVGSDEVRTELDIARDRKKPIVPAMLERVTVGDDMVYPLAGKQYVDLATIQGAAEERLKEAIRAAVKGAAFSSPVSRTPAPQGLAAALPGQWHVEVDTTVTALQQTEDVYIFSIAGSGDFSAERISSRTQDGLTRRPSDKYEGTWITMGEKGVRFDYYPDRGGGKQSFSFSFEGIEPRQLRSTTDIHAGGRRHALWRRLS
jgi:hypothetical protein